MIKQKILFLILYSFLVSKASSQGFLLTQPRLQISDNQLLIFYDLKTNNSSDKVYLWVDIFKTNGEKIPAKTFEGDVGEFVSGGVNKKIVWSHEQDSVFLNEEIYVELKAEIYNKTFNKGSMILSSTALPGWGQSRISKGKPWWLMGIAAYGAAGGGYLFHQKYLEYYDSYKIENDPVKRATLSDQAQKSLDISNGLLISAASVWVLNILWVAITPNEYLPLENVKLSLNPSFSQKAGNPVLLSLKLNF